MEDDEDRVESTVRATKRKRHVTSSEDEESEDDRMEDDSKDDEYIGVGDIRVEDNIRVEDEEQEEEEDTAKLARAKAELSRVTALPRGSFPFSDSFIQARVKELEAQAAVETAQAKRLEAEAAVEEAVKAAEAMQKRGLSDRRKRIKRASRGH